MPRTGRSATPSHGSNGRRRSRSLPGARLVIEQVTQIIATNEQLQRDNNELRAENERLRAQLSEIGSALGRMTGDSGRVRGRRDALELPAEPRPRRQRKPITDPEVLARRNQALAKARAVRAEKLAAARASGEQGAGDRQPQDGDRAAHIDAEAGGATGTESTGEHTESA